MDTNTQIVPMWKRHIAFCVDFIVLSLLCTILSILSIKSESLLGVTLVLLIYFTYILVGLYKYQTTFGLRLFKAKVEFKTNKFSVLRVVARELLFFTVATGVGFIVYLIKGPYWDNMTNSSVVWSDKIRHQ